jgi:hypothetical protein
MWRIVCCTGEVPFSASTSGCGATGKAFASNSALGINPVSTITVRTVRPSIFSDPTNLFFIILSIVSIAGVRRYESRALSGKENEAAEFNGDQRKGGKAKCPRASLSALPQGCLPKAKQKIASVKSTNLCGTAFPLAS